MRKEELLPRLKTILEPYVENQDNFQNISDQTDFIKDLEIDSATLVDLILDIEDEFGIEIDNEAMERMLTVAASVEVIQEKLKE